jgi:tetratricopeptide (TPR) repeat protein
VYLMLIAATTVVAAAGVGGARRSVIPEELSDPALMARSICSTRRTELSPGFRQVWRSVAIAEAAAATATPPPPLWDGLGTASIPITTDSVQAQHYFDQGLRLAYAFNHAEALRSFRAAQSYDGSCAMCYWGEALVLGPNINAPMDDAMAGPAYAAVRRAQQLAGVTSRRERALIAALAERYAEQPPADRRALDAAYADAMAGVARRFSEDEEIAVLYAEALMDLSPWDYWQSDSATPKGRAGEALQVIEEVLAQHPDHPGAIHLYIHLVEASTTPERAELFAERLGGLMPAAGHMVHMPSHIYYRLGRYLDSLAANRAAIAADEAYFARMPGGGLYRSGYYAHNIHFALASAQMAGEATTALAAATRLDGLVTDEIAEKHAWAQAIRSAPYFAHARFSDPRTVLTLPDPGERFPFVRAMWRYARADAAVRGGEAALAGDEAAALAALADDPRLARLVAGGVPAPDVVALAREVVTARIAGAHGEPDAAIAAWRRAIAIQDRLPYMEPPYWYYPVRQSLAATMLLAGKPEDAERTFRMTLLHVPNNAWALFGLAQAQRARSDESGAAATEELFRRAWAGGDRLPTLEQL